LNRKCLQIYVKHIECNKSILINIFIRTISFYNIQVESGGTVLSTNWEEVGCKTVEKKPPDGMEWKSWNS